MLSARCCCLAMAVSCVFVGGSKIGTSLPDLSGMAGLLTTGDIAPLQSAFERAYGECGCSYIRLACTHAFFFLKGFVVEENQKLGVPAFGVGFVLGNHTLKAGGVGKGFSYTSANDTAPRVIAATTKSMFK